MDDQKLKRPTRKTQKPLSLFGEEYDEAAWKEHWWGMPEFTMGDASPFHRITINFLTLEDFKAFAKHTGLVLTLRSDSAWYPKQKIDEPKEWAYVED